MPPITVMASRVDRHGQREARRRDEADDARVEGAAEAGEQGAHDEAAHLDADDVDAARLRAQLAAVQGAHRPARPRAGEVVGDDQGDADQAPDEPVERRGGVDLDGAEGGEGDAAEPVDASGHGFGLLERHRHELAEAERGHGEVVPLEAEARQRQQQAAEAGDRAGQSEGEKERPAKLDRRERADVRADADEGGVPERDLAGVTEEQGQADDDEQR